MAAIYAQRRGTKGGAEDEPQVSAGSVPYHSTFIMAPGPEENRQKLYAAIKNVIDTSPQLKDFRAESKKLGLSLDKLAGYLAGVDNNSITISISEKDYPSIEARRAFLDRMKGKDSPFIPLMREIKANFKELVPQPGEGEESYLMPRYEPDGYAKGGSGLWFDKPTQTYYFELERTVAQDEINRRITSSDAIMKKLGIEQEAPSSRGSVVPPVPTPNPTPGATEVAPPQIDAVKQEADFRSLLTRVKVQLDLLSKLSDYDQLNGVQTIISNLDELLTSFEKMKTDSPEKAEDMKKRLSAVLEPYASSLPEIFRSAVTQDRSTGNLYTINTGAIRTAVSYLSDAITALNAFDTLLGQKVLQSDPTASDLVGLKSKFDAMNSPSLRIYLNHLLTERYGPNGEGLAGMVQALALPDFGGRSAVDNYMSTMLTLIRPGGDNSRAMARTAWQELESQFPPQSTGQSLPQMLAASQILLYNASSSIASGVRQAWDFYSQLMAAKTFPSLSSIGEAELITALQATKSMPAGTQYLLLGNKEFFENASRLQSASSQSTAASGQLPMGTLLVSTENDIAKFQTALGKAGLPAPDAISLGVISALQDGQTTPISLGGNNYVVERKAGQLNLYESASDSSLATRLQAYNLAASYLSQLFNNKPHEERYESMNRAMMRFASITTEGDLVTDLKILNIYGLDQGHIGIIKPWWLRMQNMAHDFNSTLPFIYATFRQNSLFDYFIDPQVYPNMAPYQTSLPYAFATNEYYERLYHATSPESRIMQVYAYDNFIGLTPDMVSVWSQMEKIYRDILGTGDAPLSIREHDILAATSGNEKSRAADLQYYGRGEKSGQFISAEAFGSVGATKGSTYTPDVSGAPGLYSEFNTSEKTRGLVEAQGAMVDIANTRLWQGLARLRYDKTQNIRTDDGKYVDGYGFEAQTVSRDEDVYLRSTFPGAKRGSMIVNFFERAREEFPKKTATGGKQNVFDLIDGEILVHLDEGWARAMISKDQFQQLMKDSAGKGMPTMEDVVKHSFVEYSQKWGAKVKTDIAAESDVRRYGISKLPGNNRVGLMMILQPGIDAAIGAAKTTTGDYWVGIQGGSGAHVVAGNFYMFNDTGKSSLPTVGGYGTVPGFNQYYIPSYRRNATLQPEGNDRTYASSVTWLAIDQFRVNMFGGWKIRDGESAGWLGGGQAKTKKTATSLYLSFDKNNYLTEGLASANGGIGRVSYSAYAFRPTNSLYGGSAGAAVTVKTNDATDTNKMSFATIYGAVRENPLKNPQLNERRLFSLQERINALGISISSSSAMDMLNVKQRNGLYTNWLGQARNIATDMVSELPWYDLSYNWLATGSMGVHSPEFTGKFTYALTTGGNFYYSAISLKNKFALMGGYFNPTPKGGTQDPVEWFFSTKFMPSDEFTFGAIVSHTRDKKDVFTLQASLENAFGTSISWGPESEYYRVNLKVGPESATGVINFAQLPTFTTIEAGANIQLASSLYLAAAARNISVHRKPGMAGGYTAETKAALNLGFIPENVNVQQGVLGLTFLSGRTAVDVTGTLTKIGWKGAPYDYFIQTRVQINPW